MPKTSRPTAPVPPGHKPATEKQIRFANHIADALNIEIPCVNSLAIYRNWISNHVDDFQKKTREGEAEDAVPDWDSREAEYYFDEAMGW